MSKLSRNIVYNLAGQVLVLILGFVAVKYIFGSLGADVLGIIYFTLAMSATLSAVLQMGISATTVREVSSHLNDEPDYIHAFIQTASLFYWAAYILFSVIIFFLAPLLVEKWINLETLDQATAISILRILGVSAFLGLPRSFYTSLFRGLQRMEFNNFIDISTTGLQQVGTILILMLRGSLFHVVDWFAICYVLSILTYLVISAHFFSWPALIPKYSNDVVVRNLRYATRMMATTVFAMVHTQADKVIASILLPISIFGYYGFAFNSVSRATLVTSSISQAAFPSLSALFKAKCLNSLSIQYRKLQDLVCFSIVPLFAIIPFSLLPLFSYLLNEEAARMLLLPTTLLCLGFYMNGTLTIPHVYSLAVGKPEIAAKVNFYALFVVIPITVLLINFFGLVGAGLSWVVYHVFGYVYGIPRICKECLKIPVWSWYLHVFKIFVLIGLSYGLTWSINELIGSHSIPSFALAYVVGSTVFLSGAYFMIGEELRGWLLQFLRALRTRGVEV